MTVRQVVEKMGAPLVAGSTVHIGTIDDSGVNVSATVVTYGQAFYWCKHSSEWESGRYAGPYLHDIAHLPAAPCFLGFFGDEFDRVAQEG